jgi:hypothetical protein
VAQEEETETTLVSQAVRVASGFGLRHQKDLLEPEIRVVQPILTRLLTDPVINGINILAFIDS